MGYTKYRRRWFGVVQGSTLGPLLFLIYSNNVVSLNITSKLYLFVDDTAEFFAVGSWEVKRKESFSLRILKKWFDQNTLTLNITKTMFTYFPLSMVWMLRYNAELVAILKAVQYNKCTSDLHFVILSGS